MAPCACCHRERTKLIPWEGRNHGRRRFVLGTQPVPCSCHWGCQERVGGHTASACSAVGCLLSSVSVGRKKIPSPISVPHPWRLSPARFFPSQPAEELSLAASRENSRAGCCNVPRGSMKARSSSPHAIRGSWTRCYGRKGSRSNSGGCSCAMRMPRSPTRSAFHLRHRSHLLSNASEGGRNPSCC